MDTLTNSRFFEKQSVRYSKFLRAEEKNVLNDEPSPNSNLCMTGSI
jgi:hypothetical protein